MSTRARYRVVNHTDGILGSPLTFGSREDATAAMAQLRDLFRTRGYYLSAKGARISPDAVDLRVEQVCDE